MSKRDSAFHGSAGPGCCAACLRAGAVPARDCLAQPERYIDTGRKRRQREESLQRLPG